MKKILCFGNEFLKEDSLAKEIAEELRIDGFDVVTCSAADEILSYNKEEEVYIMDVVKDIKEVVKIKDISQIKTRSITSMHDFDLSYVLKLLRVTKQLPKVTIIGIPMSGDKGRIKKEVVKVLTTN